jgi:hypothetical protein
LCPRRYLALVKCPWVFRKLIVQTASQIEDIFITQTDDTMVFRYKMNFFGTKQYEYFLDGCPRESITPWRVKISQRALFDDALGGVVVTTAPHPALSKGGRVEHSFCNDFERGGDGRRRMVWRQCVIDPENEIDFVSEMVFVEQGRGHK